ncbi:putative disease resistance protein RGA4 [Pistacia vera]|uniref:putative disease resistance protein RGA4 n=1 Tax=Pistacia vera TaxID=55513 RepID=UPI0012634870|nr:putative disease resistance protein RGA4 [Pistacia vera]
MKELFCFSDVKHGSVDLNYEPSLSFSILLKQLASVTRQQEEEGIRLISGAGPEVEKLQSNFLAIQAVLADAEDRQAKENAVRVWLDKLIDDVLDVWNSKLQKLQIKKSRNASKPLKKRERFNIKSITKGSKEVAWKMTTFAIDVTEVYGRDEEKNRIVEFLFES